MEITKKETTTLVSVIIMAIIVIGVCLFYMHSTINSTNSTINTLIKEKQENAELTENLQKELQKVKTAYEKQKIELKKQAECNQEYADMDKKLAEVRKMSKEITQKLEETEISCTKKHKKNLRINEEVRIMHKKFLDVAQQMRKDFEKQGLMPVEPDSNPKTQ